MSVVAEHGVDRSRSTAATHQLVVAWQHPDGRAISPVGLLTFDGGYHFRYVENARSVDDFPRLLGFPDLAGEYAAAHLFPLFAQRVMDPRRPDYSRYVESLGLITDSATPWEQMARSGGRRAGDTLQLFPVPRPVDGRVSCAFLVHDMRHVPGEARRLAGQLVTITAAEHDAAVRALVPGQLLDVLDEPDNPKNAEAMVVTDGGGNPLGYVPDLLVHDLHALGGADAVTVTVLRVNPADAPSHLRLLVNLSARTPAGFSFFSGPSWEPISG